MNEIQKNIKLLKDILSGKIQNQIFVTIHTLITKRIFDDGLDSKMKQIGTYSDSYIKQRKKKGLGGSNKVNLQFTQQMKNDFLLMESGGRIGSGFTNEFNDDKSHWVEETYKKKIFKETKKEAKMMEKLIQKRIDAVTK